MYEKVRFLIVDCRIDYLQEEALLPNSFQLKIKHEISREYLQEQTERLISCKGVYHICLIGLDPLEDKPEKKFETNNETNLDISAYHESVLKYLIEDFLSKGYKYISVIPGGFKECHEQSLFYNFPLLNHGKKCYHCNKGSN